MNPEKKYAGRTIEELEELLDSYDNYRWFRSEYQDGLAAEHFDRIHKICVEVVRDLVAQSEDEDEVV